MTRPAHYLVLTLMLVVASACGNEPDASVPPAGERFITLGSTTSTRDSGLLDDLNARFEAATGISVRVVAAGTGRALEMGRRGDVDALLVHHRPSEDAFVANGDAPYRRDVMFNDFVIVGPAADPAGVAALTTATEALRAIAAQDQLFLSRGDDSGTHKAERGLWDAAGIGEDARGGGYRESGSGMGATLNTAKELGAYTLTDRGTWLAFGDRGDLVQLLEGDPPLRNPYGVLPISPTRHPHVKFEDAEAYVNWLVSDEGQRAIAGFRVRGEPLFFPNP